MATQRIPGWINAEPSRSQPRGDRKQVFKAADRGVGLPDHRWVRCTTTPTATTAAPACLARQAVAQPVGNSFAAAHVSGLAALLVAQLGRGNPALIRARILQAADDLGDPGVDPYYGKGRIN